MLVISSKSFGNICLKTSLGFWFCKFKYFKDLANQIGYVVPKINEQLGYSPNDKCWLLGYKVKTSAINHNSQPQAVKSQVVKPQNQQTINLFSDNELHQAPMNLQYDPMAKQQLTFGQIKNYANQNDFDVCIANSSNNQVTLVKLRESIYRKFYQQRIYKQKSTAKKNKQIRVPQNIQDHDLVTKAGKIKNMIKKGDFIFKIYTQNDSAKSQKALNKLCQFLGKNPKLKVQQFELQQKGKGKARIVVERWVATLNFSDQSKVNYQQVNKKWRRYLTNMKLKKQDKMKINPNNFQGLQKQSVQVQRQIINNFRQLNVSLPGYFQQYQALQDKLSLNSRNLLEQFQKDQVNKIKMYKNQKIKNKQAQNNAVQLQLRDRDMKQQIIEINNQDQQLKQVGKKMKLRTVQDILQDIQQIKSGKIQLSTFQLYKMKQLQTQLKQTLKLAGYKPKI